MYIDYDKLSSLLGFWKDFFYNKKVEQNLDYIRKNVKKVKAKLKHKEHLNVAFYVYDSAKWKCQSVYNLMAEDKRFTPYILVTKCNAPKNNFNYQTIDDVKKTYEFFESKGMNVQYAYDTKKDKFIPFNEITPRPDVIIYQHPWYVETTQGPVVCSNFALTCYVPYYISDIDNPIEYDLRFHRYIYRYYVPDEIIRKNYAPNMYDKGEKLVVAGHPQLDFYLNHKTMSEERYVIYAPHWTVCGDNLRYSTFDWNGYEILDFAEKHPEINWVFKPHPCLYKFLFMSGYMTKEKVDEYYERWGKIGLVCEDGDYMELFQQSFALITDCGSFLTEYLFTKRPCIHLVSEHFKGNENVQKICKTYYNAHNLDKMKELFEEILINKKDPKKKDRLALLAELNYPNSAKIITADLLKHINCSKIKQYHSNPCYNIDYKEIASNAKKNI